jgi:DNA-directed RNA polymerase alpha subunit
MIGNVKSTDPGLSLAERKTLRAREAQEAMTDRATAQTAFHENRERLREARLAREAAQGPVIASTHELPDDTPIERLRFSTRVREALRAEGIKTVGEIREKSDQQLLSLQNLGKGSVAKLRAALGKEHKTKS